VRVGFLLLSLQVFSVALLELKGHSAVNLMKNFPVHSDAPPDSLDFRHCSFHFLDHQNNQFAEPLSCDSFYYASADKVSSCFNFLCEFPC